MIWSRLLGKAGRDRRLDLLHFRQGRDRDSRFKQVNVRGSKDSRLKGDQGKSLMEDGQAAIHVMMQFHPGFGKAFALGSRGDLETVMIERNRVVIGHCPVVLEAEIEGGVLIFGPRQVSRSSLGSFDVEASIEFRQIRGQNPVSALQIACTRLA